MAWCGALSHEWLWRACLGTRGKEAGLLQGAVAFHSYPLCLSPQLIRGRAACSPCSPVPFLSFAPGRIRLFKGKCPWQFLRHFHEHEFGPF